MAGAIAAKLLAGQLGLSVGTIVYPWTAMRQVVEQCPHRTGTLLWIGSWVLPLMAVAWRELDSTILALILIVGALSYLSLWVAARILSRIIEEGYPRTTLYAVLGFASIPHLVVTVPIALYSDYMNVAVYTGLPAGIGLAVTGLSLLFGDDLLAAWWWWTPALITFWSAVLVVRATRHMGATYDGASIAYGAFVLVSACFWGFVGVVPFFFLLLSLDGPIQW